MGDDFQVAPNPRAKVPLPEGFRLPDVYYQAKPVKDGYDVTALETSKVASANGNSGAYGGFIGEGVTLLALEGSDATAFEDPANLLPYTWP